jgi:flagellar basal-body rod protein FlgB
MIRNLTESLDFNAQALLLRSERSRVLAGNIANADTPGFKAKDFHFGQALAQATGAAERPVTALRTHSSHLAPAGGTLATNMLYRTPMQTSLDGNSVELDIERASFAENTMRQEASLRFINGQIRTLMSAMGAQS